MSVVRPQLPGFNQYQARSKCDLATTNGARPGLEPRTPWSDIRRHNYCASPPPCSVITLKYNWVIIIFNRINFKLYLNNLMYCWSVITMVCFSPASQPSKRKDHTQWIVLTSGTSTLTKSQVVGQIWITPIFSDKLLL